MNEITKTQNVPDFLTKDVKDGKQSLAGTKQYIILPTLDIRQQIIQDDGLEPFKPGDLVLRPEYKTLGDLNNGVSVIPVFFKPEFAVIKRDRSSDNPIVTVTSDENSEIAKNARDASKWEGTWEGEEVNFTEILNIVVYVDMPEYTGPANMRFKKTSHIEGKKWISMMNMKPCEMFGARYYIFSRRQEAAGNKFFNFKILNDEENPFVTDEALYNQLKNLHNELKEKGYNVKEDMEVSEPEDDSEGKF